MIKPGKTLGKVFLMLEIPISYLISDVFAHIISIYMFLPESLEFFSRGTVLTQINISCLSLFQPPKLWFWGFGFFSSHCVKALSQPGNTGV